MPPTILEPDKEDNLLDAAQSHHRGIPQAVAPQHDEEPASRPRSQRADEAVAYSVFTPRVKWALCVLTAIGAMFSSMTANIFYPVIPAISLDLGVSAEQVNLTVTWYMIIQGLAPSFWGSICDVMGRRPVYMACFTIYIAACIGLANTHVYWLLVVLRCLQAAGSASTIAIGAGCVGDVAPPSERGGYMGVFSLGLMLGPVIGPVAGGLLAQAYNWESLFYFLAAFAGVVLAVVTIFLPETLRSMVGNGSIPATGVNRSLLSFCRPSHRSITPSGDVPTRKGWKDVRPLESFLMFGEKDILLTLTFSSIIWATFTAVVTSTSTSLRRAYGLSESALGLSFLANGGGCLIASAAIGPLLNRDYRIIAKQVALRRELEGGGKEEESKDLNDLLNFPIEHARLRSLPFSVLLVVASQIMYGWTIEKRVHLAVPLIAQVLIGFSVTTVYNCVSTLLVDLYPTKSASATAANNLYRCFLGAAATACIEPIIQALGEGWTFTMLGLLNLAFAPLVVLEWKFGMGFRRERAARIAVKELALRDEEGTTKEKC